MSSPRRVLVVVSVLVVAFAALVWIGPLTRDRAAVGSTAAPAPVDDPTLIEVEPGEELCATNILIGPQTAIAQIQHRQRRVPLPDLDVALKGDGFESPTVRVPGGRTGAGRIDVPLETPRRESIGELCIVNRGEEDAELLGTTELRTYTRLQTMVDDDPVDADLALTFFESEPVSALSRLPEIADRVASLRGFLGAPWLVWIVLVAVFAGVPLLVLRALAGALREP